MAIRCPGGVTVYRPLAANTSYVITQDEIGVFDNDGAGGGLPVWFQADGTAAALAEKVDDANGTTVWTPNNQTEPGRHGSITNAGQTITYTTGSAPQEGDCITIKYFASNQQETDDSDCDQVFLLCLGDDPGTVTPPVTDEFACTTRQSFTFTLQDLPALIPFSDIVVGGTQATAVGIDGVTDPRATVEATGISLNNLPVGSYVITTRAGNADGAFTTCDKIVNIANVGTPDPGTPDTGGPGPVINTGSLNATGAPGCAQSSWRDGVPQLRCGADPVRHVVNMRDAAGQAITTPFTAMQFGLANLPAGGVVRTVADNGAGEYTLEIDLSNVTCVGTFAAAVTYSL